MWNAFSSFPSPKPRDGSAGWGAGRPHRPATIRAAPYHKERYGSAPSHYSHHRHAAPEPMNHSHSRHTLHAQHRMQLPHVQESTAWQTFQRRHTESAIYRGTTQLEGAQRGKTAVIAAPNGPVRHIDGDAWNVYWGEYSDRFADQIDDAQEHLATTERYSSMRCVLIGPSALDEPHMSLFTYRLTDYARHFGALEHVARERNAIRVQFTTPRAAELFAVWAASHTSAEILGEATRSGGISASPELQVRVVPHDPYKISPILQLGDNIVLSTAFIEGLFKGIFEAEDVKYQAGAFQITFASAWAAKVALHSVQRHLYDEFGLKLSFFRSPGVAGGLPPQQYSTAAAER